GKGQPQALRNDLYTPEVTTSPFGVDGCSDVADQLGVADVSPIKQYTGRRQRQFDHQDEIKMAYGLRRR
ncbi:hypothetical protein, partial [Nonomuraea thailandensis]